MSCLLALRSLSNTVSLFFFVRDANGHVRWMSTHKRKALPGMSDPTASPASPPPHRPRRGLLARAKAKSRAKAERAKVQALAAAGAAGAFSAAGGNNNGNNKRRPAAAAAGKRKNTHDNALTRAQLLVEQQRRGASRQASSTSRAGATSRPHDSPGHLYSPAAAGAQAPSPPARSRSKAPAPLFKYHELALQYEDRLSRSWDPLPGIRLFLDGEQCVQSLRALADEEGENGASRLWARGKTFHHVKEHKSLFPVLCEYLKTWNRRRNSGGQPSSPGSRARGGEMVIAGGDADDDDDYADEHYENDVYDDAKPAHRTGKKTLKRPHSPTVRAQQERHEQPQQTKQKAKSPEVTAAGAATNTSGRAVREVAASPAPQQHKFDVAPPADSTALPMRLDNASARDTAVVAYFKKSKKWYPGTIWHVNLDGSFDVAFEDGDRRTCMQAPLVRLAGGAHLRSSPPTPSVKIVKGSAVRARFKMGWKYFSGTVLSAGADGFHIRYDDGEEETGVPAEGIDLLPAHAAASGCCGAREKGPVGRLGLKVGTRVEAKYNRGKKWYRGDLAPVPDTGDAKDAGQYKVRYDDGDEEFGLKRKHLWVVRTDGPAAEAGRVALRVGTAVEARHGNGLEWFGAKVVKIKSHKKKETDYELLYDDGDVEKGVARWLIRPHTGDAASANGVGAAAAAVTTAPIWTSAPLEHDGGGFVMRMHEIEGSTEVFLLPLANAKDPSSSAAVAHLSLADDDTLAILVEGGLTEEAIGNFTEPRHLCEALGDVIEIKGTQQAPKLALETN